jgi:hypothetical protein
MEYWRVTPQSAAHHPNSLSSDKWLLPPANLPPRSAHRVMGFESHMTHLVMEYWLLTPQPLPTTQN